MRACRLENARSPSVSTEPKEKVIMPMRIGTKAHRALQLLLGLRHARIAAALADYGFTDEDLQEG